MPNFPFSGGSNGAAAMGTVQSARFLCSLGAAVTGNGTANALPLLRRRSYGNYNSIQLVAVNSLQSKIYKWSFQKHSRRSLGPCIPIKLRHANDWFSRLEGFTSLQSWLFCLKSFIVSLLLDVLADKSLADIVPMVAELCVCLKKHVSLLRRPQCSFFHHLVPQSGNMKEDEARSPHARQLYCIDMFRSDQLMRHDVHLPSVLVKVPDHQNVCNGCFSCYKALLAVAAVQRIINVLDVCGLTSNIVPLGFFR